MSKYHNIKLDSSEYIVRDVNNPFKKKVRIAPMELKQHILKSMGEESNLNLVKYINSRIHFFVDKDIIDIEKDEDIMEYLYKNLWSTKNDII